MSLFNELKRRNVFRVGIAYLIAAWMLIQLSDILVPMLTLPEWVSRLVLLLLALGFIPTVIAAWALELTPAGLKLEKDVDRTESITPQTGKKLNAMIIGALALAVALLLADKLYFSEEEAVEAVPETIAEIDKSIAVLAFADLSQNRDQDWFAEGLAEEILNALARTPDLSVASRTSSFAYKESDKDLRTIAQELGVAHVLEGSVRRAGERLRVTAQLIRASDGFHLWSQNYDRDAADVIDVQEDLAVQIANALETTMDPEALRDMLRVGTRSVDAYQEYIHGQTLYERAFGDEDPAAFLEAYQHCESARRLDPAFSEAHLGAADFWLAQLSPTQTMTGLTDYSISEMQTEFLKRIDRAIESAPNSVDRQKYDADKAEFEMRYRDAIRLYRSYLQQRPNDMDTWSSFTSLALITNDTESMAVAMDRLEADVLTRLDVAQTYSIFAYKIVDPSAAADVLLAAVQRWPDDFSLLYQTHRTLIWARRSEEAAELAINIQRLFGDNEMVQARQACIEGRTDEVIEILQDVRALGSDSGNIEWLVLLLLDEKQMAEDQLRRFDTDETVYTLASWLVYTKFDPRPFAALMTILERENIDRPPPVQMPVTCPSENVPPPQGLGR